MIYWNQRLVVLLMAIIAVILVSVSAFVSPKGDELLEKKASLSYNSMSDPSRTFSVDQEANIPTWFTGAIALYLAMNAALIASAVKSQGKSSWAWRGISLMGIYIAMDEVAGFHELAIDPIRHNWDISPWLYQAWVIPAMALVILISIIYSRFILRIPIYTKVYLILGALTYVTGAIGVEAIGGFVLSTQGLSDWYVELSHIEEFMEMMGLIIILYSVVEYARRDLKSMTIMLR
ncbi:MAG: hypothetical protein RLZZ223_371 [Candidatus Parcubacteria bacterium]|jgi:hypothetical protein